jgi:hypothetical protein
VFAKAGTTEAVQMLADAYGKSGQSAKTLVDMQAVLGRNPVKMGGLLGDLASESLVSRTKKSVDALRIHNDVEAEAINIMRDKTDAEKQARLVALSHMDPKAAAAMIAREATNTKDGVMPNVQLAVMLYGKEAQAAIEANRRQRDATQASIADAMVKRDALALLEETIKAEERAADIAEATERAKEIKDRDRRPDLQVDELTRIGGYGLSRGVGAMASSEQKRAAAEIVSELAQLRASLPKDIALELKNLGALE